MTACAPGAGGWRAGRAGDPNALDCAPGAGGWRDGFTIPREWWWGRFGRWGLFRWIPVFAGMAVGAARALGINAVDSRFRGNDGGAYPDVWGWRGGFPLSRVWRWGRPGRWGLARWIHDSADMTVGAARALGIGAVDSRFGGYDGGGARCAGVGGVDSRFRGYDGGGDRALGVTRWIRDFAGMRWGRPGVGGWRGGFLLSGEWLGATPTLALPLRGREYWLGMGMLAMGLERQVGG